MSWTPKHNLHNSTTNLDWVAWGDKKAMYEIYGWKNYNNRTRLAPAKTTKDLNWVSKFVNMMSL